MTMRLGVCAGVVLVSSGSVLAQYGSINSLAEANYWYADYFGRSQLTVTNNGMTGIRYEDRNFTGGGFANRHQAALAVDGVPFQFNRNAAFQFDVDIAINGAGRSEAGIWLGTAPFFPNSASADIGQFVALPDNGGEIAAFGGVLPFFSNNQNPFDNGTPNPPGNMARAVRNTTLHFTMIYEPSVPAISYGVNGVYTGQLRGFMNSFAGISDGSLLGVYVQGPNGAPQQGDVDVQFSNLRITVPAPASAVLLGIGGLAAARRRR
ncbi:MAG: VPLPA-CTERM sorting domain-containing protein [Phycisphaerales bacterium]